MDACIVSGGGKFVNIHIQLSSVRRLRDGQYIYKEQCHLDYRPSRSDSTSISGRQSYTSTKTVAPDASVLVLMVPEISVLL